MTAAGFYPRGGGRLEASNRAGDPAAFVQTDRGPLLRLSGVAGVANLRDDIARRMRDRAIERLEEHGIPGRDRAGALAQPRAGGRTLLDRRA